MILYCSYSNRLIWENKDTSPCINGNLLNDNTITVDQWWKNQLFILGNWLYVGKIKQNGFMSHTIHKNQSQIDQTPICEK